MKPALQHKMLEHLRKTSTTNKSAPAAAALQQDSVRAWLVLLSAFLASALTLGNALTLGVLFNPIQDMFPDAHASTINMVFALTAALTYMTGSLAPLITNSIGYRNSMLLGATLAVAGFFCSSFAQHLWHLYIALGATVGIGFGLIFTPAIGVIPFYFKRYRQFAVTTATMGLAVGLIIFSRIHTRLVSSLGWQSAMQLESLLAVALFYCGIVVKNPPSSPQTLLTSNRTPTTLVHQSASSGGSRENLTFSVTTTTNSMANIPVIQEKTAEDAFPSSQETPSPSEVADTAVIAVAVVEPQTFEEEISAPSLSLFSQLKFYFILVQGLTLMCSSLFLITTTPFLTTTAAHLQWSTPNAASALTVFGVAALVMRISICIFNAFAREAAQRVNAAVPIGIGNVMVIGTACVYFFATTTSTDDGEATAVRSLFEERQSFLLLTFAAVNGAGHAIFLAYQPALVVDMLGASMLTAGFGYLNFVWGVATLLLYPAAGWVADLFGGMRYAYALGLVCCVVSLVSLIVAAVLHARQQQYHSRSNSDDSHHDTKSCNYVVHSLRRSY